ncbi:MAG: LruC domain-containing protein [Spirochaetia bacterium]|nr:LruC domain-containing protein [Spirochaetia bacterium]
MNLFTLKTGLPAVLLSALFLISCQQEDPNYQWLLSLANPAFRNTAVSDQPQTFNLQYTTSGDASFLTDAENTIQVNLNVLHESMNSSISIDVTDSLNNNTLLSFSPSRAGNFTGTFTVDSSTQTVNVVVYIDGVMKVYTVSILNVQNLNLFLSIDLEISRIIETNPNDGNRGEVLDSDGDGIPDSEDLYPNDSSRSAKIRFPEGSEQRGEAYYTAAYETHKTKGNALGLHSSKHGHHKFNYHSSHKKSHDRHDHHGKGFLHAANADFNDYVVRVSGEADLNSNGDVVKLRMMLQHVAGGIKAGKHDREDRDEERHSHHKSRESNHDLSDSGFPAHEAEVVSENLFAKEVSAESENSDSQKKSCSSSRKNGASLNLNLPVSASFTMERSGGSEQQTIRESGRSAAVQGFELLSLSETSIHSSNTIRGSAFEPGMTVFVEFTFDSPISISDLGSFPYDLYVSYKNGKREIHFPGYTFDEEGNDLYQASNGFRWALLVEGDWLWPYENTNIHKAYPEFYGWYSSGGTENTNWNQNPVIQYVFQR